MEKIADVWFGDNRIYIETDAQKIYSRPLEMFPLLLNATEQQRNDFKIGRFGNDIRWEAIDEDIHISSFLEEEK